MNRSFCRSWYLSSLLAVFNLAAALEIKGSFDTSADWPANTVTVPYVSRYFVKFENVTIVSDARNITINTSANKKRNDEVEAIWFLSKTIKFVPNVIFKIFPNADYLWFTEFVDLRNIKQEHFEGAANLKLLRIADNMIFELKANVFKKAPNLEVINLLGNQIQYIDSMAFNGLIKLKELILDNNKIKFMFVDTFNILPSLNILDLRENVCIDRRFADVSNEWIDVDKEITSNCNKNTMQDLIQRVDNLTQKMHENYKNLLDLNDQINDFDNKIFKVEATNAENVANLIKTMDKWQRAAMEEEDWQVRRLHLVAAGVLILFVLSAVLVGVVFYLFRQLKYFKGVPEDQCPLDVLDNVNFE